MNKMASSVIAGGIIGAGVWALNDRSTRKQLLKGTAKMSRKAEGLMDKMF